MTTMVRLADKQGRVSLPGFANAAVVLEAISADEYRVRKAEAVPVEELAFSEEQMPTKLSKRDANRLLKVLASPPLPNTAARRAAKRFKASHG
jgi:hypothetical protein